MALHHPEFGRVRRLKIPCEVSLLEFQFLLMEISPIPRRNTSTSLTSSDIPPVLHPLVRVLNKSQFVIILRSMSNRPKSEVDTALWNCRINIHPRSMFGVYVVFAFASLMVKVCNGIRKHTFQASCCLQRVDLFNIASFCYVMKSCGL
jgi:hypothetical protein